MPLSDDDRQRLREEEVFRDEVRRCLGSKSVAPTMLGRLNSFLETKIGFWLLSTVAVAAWTLLYSRVHDWANREELAQQKIRLEDQKVADRALHDFDALVKLVPMLSSDNPVGRDMSLHLMTSLVSAKAVDDKIAKQVTGALQRAVDRGSLSGASAQEKSLANEVARLLDPQTTPSSPAVASAASGSTLPSSTATTGAAPVASAPTPYNAPLSPPAPALAAVLLPARVYVQISSEAQRARAVKVAKALQDKGVLAPGVQLIRTYAGPTELRFCTSSSIDAEEGQVIKETLGAEGLTPSAKLLSAKLCGNARPNHFELWIGPNW